MPGDISAGDIARPPSAQHTGSIHERQEFRKNPYVVGEPSPRYTMLHVVIPLFKRSNQSFVFVKERVMNFVSLVYGDPITTPGRRTPSDFWWSAASSNHIDPNSSSQNISTGCTSLIPNLLNAGVPVA